MDAESVAALQRAILLGHAATLRLWSGRPELVEPYWLLDGYLTYWCHERQQVEQYALSLLSEVVDLQRSLNEVLWERRFVLST